ncbi:MAG TPA: DUF1684 domain-containing protein [Anaerolineales bacterium]|nr:DUF1684 domain-containing protein [Anaerolineales bacterium]
MATKKYENKVLQWRAKVYENLVRENSWLALAGLYWLNEGRNLIGSNPMCEVILPERAPTFIGVADFDGKTVRYRTAEGLEVKVNGRMVKKAILRSSSEEKPTFITWNETLRMVLHKHAGNHAIRIWDNERPERFSLPPLKWFPINTQFRVPGRYKRYPEPLEMQHPDTLGETVEDRIDGFVTFKIEGKTYKLDASETKSGKLFIRFRDRTSGKETYPSSRYYYTEPVKNGRVTIDFNFAYSPPCAFTEYATCIFAPPQNNLPFRVEAGEIYRG